jgi:hypothetical protein
VTAEPRAFFAIDLGAATTSAAIIGRAGNRWRLFGSTAFPSGVPLEPILGLLVARVRQADPELAASIGAGGGGLLGSGRASAGGSAGADGSGGSGSAVLIDAVGTKAAGGRRVARRGSVPATGTGPRGGPIDLAIPGHDLGPAGDWPRVVAQSAPAMRLAILAPTDRRRALLEAAAIGSGWAVDSASLERSDALELTTLALDSKIGALLVGAGAPISPDERGPIRTLGPLVVAVAARRPDLPIILAGGAAELATAIDAVRAGSETAAPPVVQLPEGAGAGPSVERLRGRLDELRGQPNDSRRAMIRSTASLAALLGRRIEAIDIGLTGALRCVAGHWPGLDAGPLLRWAIVAAAGLVPPEPDDALVDGVLAWLPLQVDRPRMRDRLRDLWLAPWAEASGDGAVLRLAVARAALGRLVAATPDFADVGAPDLLLVSGGAWAVAPAAAVTLAVVDVIRRQGVSQLALDHARLMGPLGTIEDEDERRNLMADLLDDLLSPLGTAVVPQGLHHGRAVGRIVVHGQDEAVGRDLVAGRVDRIDLPPGGSATAELEFRDGAVLGGRGRRFAVQVAGGVGGLLVDLRDVPLRLPDRLDRRRELLAEWQRAVWTTDT